MTDTRTHGSTVDQTADTSTRDAYVNRIKAQLDEARKQIDAFQERARGMKAEAAGSFRQQIETLRREERYAQARLRELSDASAEAWGSLRQGLDEASESLRRAVTRAANDFRRA
jgi:hypothetical protein